MEDCFDSKPGSSMIAEENILSLIPQRPPFVMIDKLLSCDDNLTRTAFQVTAENVFVAGGLFREPGLMENMAQTAAAGAGYRARMNNLPVQVGYIGAVKNLEITGLPRTEDELITEIKMEDQVAAITRVSGKIWCHEIMIAQCEMTIILK
jgi:predicted hotdog family 3-hydroxylacyl-ACP dehydratase